MRSYRHSFGIWHFLPYTQENSIVNKTETSIKTAERQLLEETGYKNLSPLKKIADFYRTIDDKIKQIPLSREFLSLIIFCSIMLILSSTDLIVSAILICSSSFTCIKSASNNINYLILNSFITFFPSQEQYVDCS